MCSDSNLTLIIIISKIVLSKIVFLYIKADNKDQKHTSRHSNKWNDNSLNNECSFVCPDELQNALFRLRVRCSKCSWSLYRDIFFKDFVE